MEISLKSLTLVVIGAAVVSAAVTKYYFPRTETKIEIQEKETVKNNIVTQTHEIVKPDGSKEIDTTIVDTSTEKKSSKQNVTIIEDKTKNWSVSLGEDYNFTDKEEIYAFAVNRRILGPFFIGARANTKRELGLQLVFEF